MIEALQPLRAIKIVRSALMRLFAFASTIDSIEVMLTCDLAEVIKARRIKKSFFLIATKTQLRNIFKHHIYL